MSNRRTLLISCCCLLLTMSCQSPRIGKEDGIAIKPVIDRLVAPLLNGKDPLQYLVVGVINGDRQTVYGYGARQRCEVSDGNALFRIASLTKPLTALLLAQLVTDGKLKYDDTAIDFKGRPVTFCQLVTHTSGLPVMPSNVDRGKAEYAAEDFRQFLDKYSLTRAPGREFEYSTVGYATLGMQMNQKCGMATFEDGLTKRILEPIGMKSTVFELTKDNEFRFVGDAPHLAAAHGQNVFSASGGLISSANDLLKLLSANLRPEALPGLNKAILLTQQPRPEIKTFQGSIAALGWQVLMPMKFYWHSGIGPDFRGFITFETKSRCGVVMLTNTGLQPMDSRIEQAGFGILGVLLSNSWSNRVSDATSEPAPGAASSAHQH